MRERLINERKKKGLTRAELASELSIAEITVRKIEEGSRNPSPQMAKKFALFFKKELDYLFPDIFLIKFDTKHINS